MKNIKKLLAIGLVIYGCGICFAETNSLVVIPKKESESTNNKFDASNLLTSQKPLNNNSTSPALNNKPIPESKYKEESVSDWFHKYYKFLIFPIIFYWGMKQFGKEKEKKKTQYKESMDVDISQFNSPNLDYEVIEHHRLFTNAFAQVRRDKATGEIYYYSNGHLKPELQGKISKLDYEKLIEKSIK